VGAKAATAPTASVDQHIEYRNHAAGQVYTFTINPGTAVIKSMAVGKSSSGMTITACSTTRTGWTGTLTAGACGFKHTTGSDVTAPTTEFKVTAKTLPGAGGAINQWLLVANPLLPSKVNIAPAATPKGALTTGIFNVQLTDAAVVASALPIGGLCPGSTPTNHSAAALSTKNLVVCGRNWGADTFKPNPTDSKLLGTFAVKDTLVTSDPAVAAGAGTVGGAVVIANYKDALIGPTPGTANLFGIMVQSAAASSPSTSQPLMMTNFEVLCLATYTVDIVNGDDTTGTGTCGDPWKHIKKATDVAASGDSIQVNKGTYDTAAGETFPVAVPDNVKLTADLNSLIAALKQGKFDSVKIMGDINLGSGAQLIGVAAIGQTTFASNSKAQLVLFNNLPSANPPSFPICIDTNGTGVTLDTVLAIGCGYGMRVEPGSTVNVRKSYFVKNVWGVHVEGGLTNGIADLGTNGSPGANTLCGAIDADLWDQVGTILTPTTIQAVGNRWDHVPPTTNNLPLQGVDIALLKPAALTGMSVNTASATLASSDPLSSKLCAAAVANPAAAFGQLLSSSAS
jgi:hypothetical protein